MQLAHTCIHTHTHSLSHSLTLACTLAGVRKQAVAVLLLASLGFATYGSLYVHPYSTLAPKRAVLNHIHVLQASGGRAPSGERSRGEREGGGARRRERGEERMREDERGMREEDEGKGEGRERG
jgi:hypothetical protein